MIKPDIVTVNSTHVDMPLFRYQIRKYRHLFDKVILAFSQHTNLLSVQGEIYNCMKEDDVVLLSPEPYRNRDWRDVATNLALVFSKSDWVLFLEPDFIIKNEELLEKCLTGENEIVGFREGNRLHPAFLLIHKKVLNRTSKDFSVGPGYDHFGMIWKELEWKNYKPTELADLGFNTPDDWEHLASFTHNYTLLMRGEEVIYKPERFGEYNREVLNLDIPQCPSFLPYIIQGAAL